MTEKENEFISLADAARYTHTTRQAIFVAIKKGNLKAEKKTLINARGFMADQWTIKRSDLDDYRRSKYNREKRVVNGEKLFDMEKDRFSVLHAAKIISQTLKIYYPYAKLYYLLRIGQVRGFKKAGAWVIKGEEILKIIESISKKEEQKKLLA